MAADSAFQGYLDSALEVYGIEADETERAVMAGVLAVYEPALDALSDADLGAVQPEPNADLSQPPR
jgi:hypothetical protein